MPDLQDLTSELIETMTARRAAVTQAIEALEALDGTPMPAKKPRLRLSTPVGNIRHYPPPKRKKVVESVRMPRAAFLETVERTLRQHGKPMRVVQLRDALLKGALKGRNPKALYNQICNNLAGKKQFRRTPEGVSLA